MVFDQPLAFKVGISSGAFYVAGLKVSELADGADRFECDVSDVGSSADAFLVPTGVA